MRARRSRAETRSSVMNSGYGVVAGECPAHEVSARWQAGLFAYRDLQGFRGGLDGCGVVPVGMELAGGFLDGRVQVGESQG